MYSHEGDSFPLGYNIVVTPNCRILNPERVKELYITEGEAVTWGSMHYKYVLNEVIKNRDLALVVVMLVRPNAGASWELQVREATGSIAMAPLEWVRRARTSRWEGEDFKIHYELLEGLEELG